MKRSRNKLYQFVAAACLPISLTAQAQLEEVIVTAQKRAESLQDVPIFHQYGKRREDSGQHHP